MVNAAVKKKSLLERVLTVLLAVVIILSAAALLFLAYAGRKFYAGPFRDLSVTKITSAYKDRPKGEIVFYGASNFNFWTSMEDDLQPFIVQNHGFGGSTDADMIERAGELLYPYEPSVVVFQTGSNGLVGGQTLANVLDEKRAMYAAFRARLPGAAFVVMSGLPLPGRAELWDDTVTVNDFLRQYCAEHEGMFFADATALMLTADGAFRPEYFNTDGVHLNKEGRGVWGGFIKGVLANDVLQAAQ